MPSVDVARCAVGRHPVGIRYCCIYDTYEYLVPGSSTRTSYTAVGMCMEYVVECQVQTFLFPPDLATASSKLEIENRGVWCVAYFFCCTIT